MNYAEFLHSGLILKVLEIHVPELGDLCLNCYPDPFAERGSPTEKWVWRSAGLSRVPGLNNRSQKRPSFHFDCATLRSHPKHPELVCPLPLLYLLAAVSEIGCSGPAM